MKLFTKLCGAIAYRKRQAAFAKAKRDAGPNCQKRGRVIAEQKAFILRSLGGSQ